MSKNTKETPVWVGGESGQRKRYLRSLEKDLAAELGPDWLMLLFDISIEPLSDRLNFWFFKDENLYFNYITWFILGLVNQYIYFKFNSRKNIIFSFHTYFSILLFFIILNISF